MLLFVMALLVNEISFCISKLVCLDLYTFKQNAQVADSS